MKEFRIGPEGLKAFRKLILKRMLFIVVPIILVVGGINIFNISRNLGDSKDTGLTFWFIWILGVALIFGLLIFRVIKRNERLFKSYVLTVENILIRREQWNTPEVDIYFNEIIEIRKTKSKWLIVKGRYAGDVIFIPPYLDNFKELEDILREIQPFTTKATGTFFEKYRAILVLVSLVSMIVALIVDNPIIDSICVCIYGFITIRNYIDARKNKNIDNKTRQRLWIQLAIGAFIVIVIVIKILGTQGIFFNIMFPFSK